MHSVRKSARRVVRKLCSRHIFRSSDVEGRVGNSRHCGSSSSVIVGPHLCGLHFFNDPKQKNLLELICENLIISELLKNPTSETSNVVSPYKNVFKVSTSWFSHVRLIKEMHSTILYFNYVNYFTSSKYYYSFQHLIRSLFKIGLVNKTRQGTTWFFILFLLCSTEII